jgi:hypothetical protein
MQTWQQNWFECSPRIRRKGVICGAARLTTLIIELFNNYHRLLTAIRGHSASLEGIGRAAVVGLKRSRNVEQARWGTGTLRTR